MSKLTALFCCMSGLFLASTLAVASETYSPEALGAIEAVFDSCGKLAPRSGEGRDAGREKEFEGISQATLKRAREAKEYTAAYTALTTVLRDEIPRAELVKACAELGHLGGGKSREQKGETRK